jgi:hypothetical protein
MDYSQAAERFNLDKTLKSFYNLDFIELINSLQWEITNSESIKISSKIQMSRDVEYLKSRYVSDLKGLVFLLQQGFKPIGVSNDSIQKFKPLIEELIRKGQLETSIIKVIE